MTREYILDAAKSAVTGQREQDYGTPEDNFKRIASLWGDYLDYPVRPSDVAAMMVLLKVARIRGSEAGSIDSWVDIAGYAACGAEVMIRPGAEVQG